MKKKISILALAVLPFAINASTPLWLRDAAISPDGSTIAFRYKGDIWTVPATGGDATRLTFNNSFESTPVWSPDSKSIAFASDRYGNSDIFIIDAKGGTPLRLTYNSASETPEAFSPDGKHVLFSASIQDPAQSILFPVASLPELYQVPVKGGKMQQVLGTPAHNLAYIPNGKGAFLYQDNKGMENKWRKHHTSSITRDIWLYDPKDESHKKVITHAGEDRNPIMADANKVYFLSERDGGSMNVYTTDLNNPSNVTAVTKFKTHPVRFLSRANNGILCFTYDGEIYTLAPGNKSPEKTKINLVSPVEDETYKTSASSPSEISVSPDGKSIAFISRGDVFVTSVDYKTTKQITNTPEAENHVGWGHDSKSLYYTSERDGKYNIYEAKMGHEDDPNFANATIIEEKPVFKADSHERSVPMMSPDGKKLAFLLDRRKIAVRDMESGKVKELTDGSTLPQYHGQVNYTWSPDSKWITMEIIDRKHDPFSDVALINASTGEMTNLSNSAYFDEAPRFVLDGNAILYRSDKYGMRNHASWGSMQDVMLVFLNQKAYDDFKLNKEDAELAEEASKAKKDDKKDDKKSDKKDEKKDDKKDKADEKTIDVELDGITDRIVRLTPFSSELYDAIITDDGKNLFFITESADKNMLWKVDLRGGEVEMSKTISSGLRNFETSKDGKTMFIVGNSMQKFTPSSLKLTPVNYSATYKLDPAKEREYMYDNMIREEQARFYDVNMHGVNWDALTKDYRKFLPHINNNYDFSEMASELLGELNVSHTGSGYRGNMAKYSESTAQLGLLYDLTYNGKGLKVDEIIENGPFSNSSTKVAKGVVIEKINGEEITNENDYTTLLNDIAGKKTLVSLYNPQNGERWTEVVKPITASKMNSLLYKRWIKQRAEDVDKWSNGRLGYVHIQSMNDGSFREMYADVLGKYNDREGIVIDVRRNGGGRMHEDIEVLFSGEKYLTQIIRGKESCDMPSKRWNKPSIMVTCEACYSNAHGTPWVYQHQKLGKIVGMPVPGTMTSVNWVTMQDPTLYFGIPVIGYRTAEGYYLENHQLEPDVVVENNPADIVKGEDAQLRKAVEELLKDIDSNKKK